MIGTPPVNGSEAARYNYAERELGIYLNRAGGAWPELRERLTAICRDKVATLAFVPAGWLADVRAVCGDAYAPVVTSPYLTTGAVNPSAPSWLAKDKSYLDAWQGIANACRAAVVAYAAGKIEEGRKELDALERDAAFWDGLYRITKAVADAPANAVSAVAGGVSYVAGGVLGSLFKSWVFWAVAAAAGGFAAWRLGILGPLAKRAAAKATGAKAG